MDFNKHSDLLGKHAILSASKYHWINYDIDKLRQVYRNYQAVQQGTELHDLAARLIRNHVRLPKNKQTLNLYVNDAIGYRMTPEQPLFYSQNWFGTADAISCRDGLLRIHDLKTGEVEAKMFQLEIYAALYCLEYGEKPSKLDMELRIYQNNEVLIHKPNPADIQAIMNKGMAFDKEIEKLKREEAV